MMDCMRAACTVMGRMNVAGSDVHPYFGIAATRRKGD